MRRKRSEHAGSPAAVQDAAAGRCTSVLAVAECIIGGVRRSPGERFDVPADQTAGLIAYGYVLPDAWMDLMNPEVATRWRQAPREGLTAQSLVCDDATADRLWNGDGRILSPDGIPETAPAAVVPGALRVLQLTHYDPGSSVYRYHSAANSVPGIVSALVRWGDSNAHCSLRQWDGDLHRTTVELLAMTADVIHVHMNWRTLHHDLRYALASNQRAAITYHGSAPPDGMGSAWLFPEQDQRMGAMTFGARPYHARFGVPRYLPIPVPVATYRSLASGHTRGPVLRIAHSPTKRAIKGTDALVGVVEALRAELGPVVELVMIEGLDHGAALRVKATCDVTFDSFWLGMQGSGIEGAAMGQPVLAGDIEAADEAAALNGGVCPWTFTPDADALAVAIRRLVTDRVYFDREAARVGAFVARVHDYAAVGARYRDFLTGEA